MDVNIWIGNLGAYNRGALVGEWISLPIDPEELSKRIKKILGPYDEEYFIADYEADFKIEEYSNPHRINEIAEEIQMVNKDALYMILEYFYSDIEEAIEIATRGNYMILHDIGSMRELAEVLVEEYDYIGQVPDRLRSYLDWEAIINSIDTDTQWRVDEGKKIAFNLWD